MTTSTCEHCGKQAINTAADELYPAGWLLISTAHLKGFSYWFVCSIPCAIAELSEHAKAQQEHYGGLASEVFDEHGQRVRKQ